MKFRGFAFDLNQYVQFDVISGEITNLKVSDEPVATDYIGQGLFDIQVNGYQGVDYSSPTFDSSQVISVVKLLASAGVVKHLPTITTAPQNRIIRFIEEIKRARKSNSIIAKAVPGIHIEGPYISHKDGPRGTHDIRYVRAPSIQEFMEWYTAAEGLLSIVTLAPELEGAIELIKNATELGVVVAIGHTAASRDTIFRAIEAGAKLSTHLGNGSATVIPRLKNYLWPQLASNQLSASIIADGYHLPPEVIEVITRAKGLDNLILVSDVAPLGGAPIGKYSWGNVAVEVYPDGHIGLPNSEILAGAAHLLDWDIGKFIQSTEITLKDSLKLCTQNPANLLGFEYSPWKCSEGDVADFVSFTFDPKYKRFINNATYIEGELMYTNMSIKNGE